MWLIASTCEQIGAHITSAVQIHSKIGSLQEDVKSAVRGYDEVPLVECLLAAGKAASQIVEAFPSSVLDGVEEAEMGECSKDSVYLETKLRNMEHDEQVVKKRRSTAVLCSARKVTEELLGLLEKTYGHKIHEPQPQGWTCGRV